MKKLKPLFLLLFSFFILPGMAQAAQVRVDYYEDNYELNQDLTYTETITVQKTLLTPRGVENGQRAEETFFPRTQSLELLEAYVIQPDGQKVPVTEENIFTRPSRAAEDAPGFTDSQTTTVLFPKLQVKSKTFVKWRLVQKKPPVLGFSVLDVPSFNEEVKNEKVEISAPRALSLFYGQRGGFAVEEKKSGDRKIITALIKDQPEHLAESHMTSTMDVSPVFACSTLNNWQQLGEIYWSQSKSKVLIAPEIKKLADQIAGKQTGRKAAAALYNWVAQNIQYVAVYLSEAEGYVPHTSVEVLKNGYGDCKDKVLLLQALLKAKGIESSPVLADWDEMYELLPVPSPEQFNHVMIYLPEFKIYANPTDRFASFGMLDHKLQDKFVVIAGEKSQTAYTPKALAKDNRYEVSNQISLSENGLVNGKCRMSFSGSTNIDARNLFSLDETPEQIAQAILAQTPEGGKGTLSAQNSDDLDRPIEIMGDWESPYAVNMGQQAFFSPPYGLDLKNPHRLREFITSDKRQYPITIGAQELAWNFEVSYPKKYQIAIIPQNIEFKNDAGIYTSKYENKANKLLVERRLTLEKTVYPFLEYPALEELLYKAINDARAIVRLAR